MASDDDGLDKSRSSKRRHHDSDEPMKRHRSDREFKSRNGRSGNDRKRSRDRGDGSRSVSPDPSRRRRSRDRHSRREHGRDRDREHGARRRRSRSRDKDKHSSRRRTEDRTEPERNSDSRKKPLRIEGPLPSQADSFAVSKGEEPEKSKEKPNYGNSGVLAAASNSVTQTDGTSITLKYHEPAEARKPPPKDQWKLFIFKGADIVDTVDLSVRSCWLIGREMAVVDLHAEHPSISKQHAVIQFRHTERRNEFGDKIGKVKPYLIDLESANGTVLNEDKVPESRYLELRDKDVIQFGQSTREYVVMLAPKD